MTNEQVAAAKKIKEIADTNNLVVAAIWCASDVVSYFNENEDKITLDDGEEMLFNWEKQLKENAIENGYHVISMMMELENDN